MIKKIFNFLVYSSADPRKFGLSVKGVLIGVIPTVITLSGFVGVDLGGPELLTSLVNAFVAVLEAGLWLVSAIAVFYGVARKFVRTVQGRNLALQVD